MSIYMYGAENVEFKFSRLRRHLKRENFELKICFENLRKSAKNMVSILVGNVLLHIS